MPSSRCSTSVSAVPRTRRNLFFCSLLLLTAASLPLSLCLSALSQCNARLDTVAVLCESDGLQRIHSRLQTTRVCSNHSISPFATVQLAHVGGCVAPSASGSPLCTRTLPQQARIRGRTGCLVSDPSGEVSIDTAHSASRCEETGTAKHQRTAAPGVLCSIGGGAVADDPLRAD